MKIAYIANIRFPTEKAHGIQIAKACEALAKLGEDITLIVPARKTPIKDVPLLYYGVQTPFLIKKLFAFDTVSFGLIGFWVESFSFAVSVLAYLRSHSYEVIFGRDELVLTILWMGGNRAIFWESHDGTWNIFSQFIARRAKGVVVVSEGLRNFYIEKGVPAEKIFATPNGIDLAKFANPENMEVSRKRFGLPQDKKIALYIGRLDGWKGADTLLDASNLLPQEVSVALIGGEEEQIASLKEKYPKVIFLGFRPYNELPDNQSAGDVLIVPNTGKSDISVHFTSPLKLIAHMASKRPIVASDLPSIRELVGENEAVLVQPDDPKALAEGILRALSAPLGDRVAWGAYSKVSQLDWGIRAKAVLAFLQEKLK